MNSTRFIECVYKIVQFKGLKAGYHVSPYRPLRDKAAAVSKHFVPCDKGKSRKCVFLLKISSFIVSCRDWL